MNEIMITNTIEALRKNNFEVYRAKTLKEAGEVFHREILSRLKPETVTYGDSITMMGTGVIEKLKNDESITFLDTFDESLSWREKMEVRKKALTADLFLTGANALTETGMLINLDMVGNRVGGTVFGPRKVVIFASVKKITKNLEEGMKRVREVAAPLNAIRHPNLTTPCQKTGRCHDCSSPERICNVWTIHEKSYPVGRIKIILIDEPAGL